MLTSAMLRTFIGNRDDTYYNIIMEGSELTEVSYEKDFGVWISADMKMF